MIRKGILVGIYRAVPGRGSRELCGRHGGASLSRNGGPGRPGGKDQGHSQNSKELRASRTRADTTSCPGAPCLPQQKECDCSILSCSLSPSCHSPWVHSHLGLRPSCAHIYGGRVPVKQRLEHPKPVVGRESGCLKRRVRPDPCG